MKAVKFLYNDFKPYKTPYLSPNLLIQIALVADLGLKVTDSQGQLADSEYLVPHSDSGRLLIRSVLVSFSH